MQATSIDIVRGELERLFSLEEMTQLSEKLLGLDPADVGGTNAKASFARALTERCVDGDRLDALVDVIRVSRREVDPRVFDVVMQVGREELAPGRQVGEFTVQRKIGESDFAIVYQAVRAGKLYALKILRQDVTRDARAVQRFLTANRFVGGLSHPGLPEGIEAGELEDGNGKCVYVAYHHVDAQSLAAKLGMTGPSHVNELRTILRGILEPLSIMHRSQLVHGDLKLENVLLARPVTGGAPNVVLVDFGGDKLHRTRVVTNGHAGVMAIVGSPKTIAPELVRGKPADIRSDVYAFGAMMYELLSGKSVFSAETATDAAFLHLTKEPEPPSTKAPRGWVTKEIDDFVLAMLSKDPSRRPRDAQAVLDGIGELGRQSQALRAAQQIPKERVEALVLALLENPADEEGQIALEKAVEEGAESLKVAEAFVSASERVEGENTADLKKGLLYRAARIFETAMRDKVSAEKAYAKIVEIDPSDDVALSALEDVRRSLGKYEEIVEMLLERSANVPAGEERARSMAEIGRLYASELDDPEQALIAYTQALCEFPQSDEYATRVEELAGGKSARWNETLASITEAIAAGNLAPADQSALLCLAGKWYEAKVQRADLALMAFQQVIATEPAHEKAGEGLTQIYRRAQQWPELVAILISRADAAGSTPRARDYRVEAAELLETKLNDPQRASNLYDAVLSEDPGHLRASDAVARIAERMADFPRLIRVLENRAEARRGHEKAEALARVAEVFEDHMSDLNEATRRFEAVLAVDPSNVTALKGLDRIFNRSGRYRELLEVLERQVQNAATPRQKINLFERIAALHDEEFLDHAQAAAALEEILKIDPAHDGALTGLVRHYRALDRWDRVVAIYEKHAAVTTDDSRKLELYIAKARALADQFGSPDRAMKVYEQVLQIQPDHAGALEALAQLKEQTGDTHAALSAIEALAFKASTAEIKAEQWMRAARLLESRGDKDGAIERYKLALDANAKDASASTALRKAYGERGDFTSVVALAEKELATAEGALAKARLHAEIARVQHRSLNDAEKAEASAKKALELDASNVYALVVLGDIAYEGNRMLEASRHLESVVGRTAMLEPDDATRVLVRFLESFGKANRPSVPPTSLTSLSSLPSSQSLTDLSGPPSGGRISVAPPPSVSPPPVTNPRMIAAVEALQTLAPANVEAMARATEALFEFGDARSAFKMSEDLLKNHGKNLAGSERAQALFTLGESARRCGEFEKAIEPLKEAADLDAANPKPLRALAKVHEERNDFAEAVKVKRRRLQIATGQERFELLLEIGDLEFTKLQNRKGAEKSYVAALEEKPDDRKLLAKLMQLYSEEKDWAKLVEVVLRLADFVEDKKQRAKYMHTAATIAARHLNQDLQAIQFYEEALACDPTLNKAAEEAIELHKKRGEHSKIEKIFKQQLEQAKVTADRGRIVKVLDQLGELYRRFLGEPELAIDAFEAAQAFDPEDRARAETLAELYASDVKQYLDKAVRSQAAILRRNPYRVESYKLLRKLYTDSKKADPAWCLCQALSVLNLAEPDEERFYKKHRTEGAAAAQTALEEADSARIAHPEADPLVTKIFALIQPMIIRARTQTLESMGYDPRYAIDTSLHPYPISQTLYYAQGVLGMSAPQVFQNPNDPQTLGFLHAQTPSIVLGRGAFDTTIPTQTLAFMAGRHLVYFRPGLYVRHLVPTGTGLKAWLFAAIKLCVPQFPIAPDLQGQVVEAMGAMSPSFQGGERDKLASLVSKLLQSGGAIDLKKWVASIDFTADRAGLLLAHDLQTAVETARANEAASSVPVKERMKELVLFSISEEYFALREKLVIAIDS